MDWVWSTPGRAVIRKRLTACARHSSKDLAALQQVVLSLVDLCTGCQSVCGLSSYASTGMLPSFFARALWFLTARSQERSVPRLAEIVLATKIDCNIPSNCDKKAFASFSRGSAAELVAIAGC